MTTIENGHLAATFNRAPGLRDMLAAFREGKTTAYTATKLALRRAEACKKCFNAFTVINWDRALESAWESDRRYATGQPRQLEGLPIAIKDLIDTRSIETQYGSLAYKGHVPISDAEIVKTLLDMGAILIGKTTTHEFAWGVTTSSPAFGDTLNPLDRRLIPGGSSGGGAAAVAGGAVAAGVGTDTGGSVRIPAALCGVVGFKPTWGTLSTRGIFPLAPTLDHPGMIGQSVDDIIVLAETFDIGISESDAWLSARLGVIHGIPPVFPTPSVSAVFSDAIRRLSGTFTCDLVGSTEFFDGAYDAFASIVLTEGSIEHHRRSDERSISTLYSEDTRARLDLAKDVRIRDYAAAQEARHSLIRRMHTAMSDFDYLVLPTCPCTAPAVGVNSIAINDWSGTVRQALMSYTAPFNLSGFPAISIPLHTGSNTLPAAMQIVGRPGADCALLKIASEIEQLLQGNLNHALAPS